MKDVTLWYEAFNRNDPALLDRILSEKWIDIPPAPGQPAGLAGAKQILVELTTAEVLDPAGPTRDAGIVERHVSRPASRSMRARSAATLALATLRIPPKSRRCVPVTRFITATRSPPR